MDDETALIRNSSLDGSTAQVAHVTRYTHVFRHNSNKHKNIMPLRPGPREGHELRSQLLPHCQATSFTQSPPTIFQVSTKDFLFSSFCSFTHLASLWTCKRWPYHFFRPAIFAGQKSSVWSRSCTRFLLLGVTTSGAMPHLCRSRNPQSFR